MKIIKHLIIIMMLVLPFTFSLSFSVTATIYDDGYGYGFEDTTATQQVTALQSDFFTSYEAEPEGEVDTTHAYEGTKSYRISEKSDFTADGEVYFNSTLGSTAYIKNMSFWIYSDGVCNNNIPLLEFRLRAYDGDSIRFAIGGSGQAPVTWLKLMYYDHNSVWQTVFDGLMVNTWNFIYFNFNDNDSVVYGCKNGSIIYETAPVQPYKVVDNPTWDYLFLRASIFATNGKKLWIDNFNMTMATQEEPVTFNTTFQNGNIGQSTSVVEKRYIEDQYTQFSGLGLQGIITKVELSIGVEQYNLVSSTTTDYSLYVDGLPMGNPTSFDTTGPTYWIVWDSIEKTLSNNHPIFSFGCTKQFDLAGNTYYWYAYGVDTEGGEHKYHNTSSKHTNGLYDGTLALPNLVFRFTVYNLEIEDPPAGGVPPTTDDLLDDAELAFKLYDFETGNRLGFYNPQHTGIKTGNYITGDIWIKAQYGNQQYLTNKLDYDKTSYTASEEVTGTATIGQNSYNIVDVVGASMGDIEGVINSESITFERYIVERILTAGNSYDIWLTPIDFVEGGEFENEEEHYVEGLTTYLATDKKSYILGEQIILKYKLPSRPALKNAGKEYTGWHLVIHTPDLGIIDRTVGDFVASSVYDLTEPNLVYGDYAYAYIDSSTLNAGIGVTSYEVNVGNEKGGLFGWGFINGWLTHASGGLYFNIVNGTFTPSGNIVSVTPSEPYMGETVTVLFTANNSGRFVVNNLMDKLSDDYYYDFAKPVGTATQYVTFYDFASYKLSLEVWSGTNFTEVDYDYIYVNTSGANFSGYNVSYMEISRDRYIAGYHYGEIAYKVLNSTAVFHIMTPKGERSRFSTELSVQEGVHRFFIFKDSQIGRYNVTMYDGNEVFNSYFYVVYDEHNYIEFSKHEYRTNEYFSVYVKHNIRVGIIFLKENENKVYIPKGSKTILEKGTEDGFWDIPLTTVTPTKGNWRVQLWSVNNLIPIRLLATDDCIVNEYVAIPDYGDGGDGSILPPLGTVVGAIVGLIVTMFCLFAPLLVVKGLSLKQKIPDIGFALSGGLGVGVSVILGFFPFWILPFILIIGIMILALQYVIKTKKGD